jgi:SAM-dependent methyltransferase
MSEPTAAQAYWANHYADAFRFGEGTEDLLAMLQALPPVRRWADFGSGAESLLWAIGLDAAELTAVDADPDRLARLTAFAAAARPRPVHTTAAELCGHADPDAAFTAKCRSLRQTIAADCLTGRPPAVPRGGFDLVTQFGLLGLCQGRAHFLDCTAALHALLKPGGWCAGANWVRAGATGRVALDEDLYRDAARRSGITLHHLQRIASADPAFPVLFAYTGRKQP